MTQIPSIATVGEGLDRKKAGRFVAILVIAVALVTLMGAAYFPHEPGTEFDDGRLSVIDFNNESYTLVEKESVLGRELVERAYGPYSRFILENNVELSISSPVEIAIPTFLIDSTYYGLREGLSLRYRLWREHSPDVVLLGSSMLFMNFRRAEFYRQYPGSFLIDFTLGNNVPPLTEALFAKLDDLDLEIEPGTLFIYGMKAWEFDRTRSWGMGPGRQQALDEVDALRGRFQDEAADAVSDFLRFEILREHLYAALRPLTRALQRNIEPEETRGVGLNRQTFGAIAEDPVALRSYLRNFPQTAPDDGSPAEPLDEVLVDSVLRIAQRIQRAGGRLLIVQLPDSTYSTHRMERIYKNFNHGIEGLALQANAGRLDLSRHEDLGIDDRNFIWPNGKFDPNHLNAEGSMVFTRRLIQQGITPVLGPASGR